MLEELRRHYTENEIDIAVDEWLDEATNYKLTAKDVTKIVVYIVAHIIALEVIVVCGCKVVDAICDKVSKKKSTKREEHN